jgi:Uma2 family endonuclease
VTIAKVAEPVTEESYFRQALASEDAPLEFFQGRIREKPSMSAEHNDAMFLLGLQLGQQVVLRKYRVRVNAGRTRRPRTSVFIPDVMVIPIEAERTQRLGPGHLEVYNEPLPFVAEFWSQWTGDYDVMQKLPEYRERGDLEIWLVHPYDRTVVAWRRRSDDTYDRVEMRGSKVRLFGLPDVTVDLDEPFEV